MPVDGLDRLKLNVGALGWLSSCRQAYAESISTLYSTNRFRLREQDNRKALLFRNLDSLLLPQRLASMKHLELVWDFEHFGRKSKDPDTGKPVFDTLLDILISSLPNLADVHIRAETQNYVQDRPGASSQPEETLFSMVISPMDNLVARFGTQLRHCELIVRWSYYKAMREGLGEEATVEELHRSISHRKFWRYVENGDGALRYRVGYLPDIIS
ncbi:MAG: hypothetical protein M1816_007177 [Peltula sp. TS41687]|nr:MAG: hypothetical protein M1816_007177 [Peltula sp. TS41687]